MRGTELKKTIDASVSQTRKEAETSHRYLREASGKLDQLVRNQAQAAGELADVVIKNVGSHTSGGDLGRQIRESMERRDAEQDELQQEIETLRKQCQEARTFFEGRQDEQTRADEAVGELESACLDHLHANHEGIASWKLEAETYRSQIKRSHAKLETAKQDASDKAPAYEGDPMFSYLLARGFGQARYQAGPLTGRLDEWVARLVQFPRYFADYQRLKAIPDRIAEHIEHLESQLGLLEEKIDEAIRNELAQWPGYPRATEEFLYAQAHTEAAKSKLDDLEVGIQEVERQLSVFLQGHDSHTKESKALITKIVLEGQKDRARLLVEASDTAEDDRLLEHIQTLETQIILAEERVDKARSEHAVRVQRHRQAQEFSNRFDREGLGRSNRRYSSTSPAEVAQAILLGRALDRAFQRIKSDARIITPPSPSSTTSRSSSSWGGGGRSFGGGFSTGGGRGGGGFRTGGGV